MAIWFNDTFTDTDLALLSAHTSDSGGTWVQMVGPSPQIFAGAVSGKSLIGPGPSGQYSIWRTSVIAPNADAKIPFSVHKFSDAFTFMGVGLRMSGAGSETRGYVGIYNKGASRLEIYKCAETGQLTGSPLGTSSTFTIADGSALSGEFKVEGSNLTLTLGANTATASDNTITAAGYAAMVFNDTQGNGIFIDSLSPQDIASAATAVTLTGPTSGNVGAASSNFTVGANGTITGTVTVTPSDGGAGGTFTPTSVAISAGTPTATFTYTSASNGAKTISVTNNGSLSNPSNITYTAVAVGAPTAGVASLTSTTPTTINVSATAASGGTAPLTYQWYRSTVANVLGSALSGATGLTLADSTGLAADTPYYYACRVTDAAANMDVSNQIAGVLKSVPLVLGFIGDSITAGFGLSAGQDPASQIAPILKKLYKNRAVTVSNQAVSGSKTSQWVTGQTNLNNAKTAFATAGVTHVHIMLGANDAAAGNLVSAATFKSNLQNIIADLTGAGYKIILSYPTYIPAGANSNATTTASVALAQSYQAQIDSLIDGVNVLRGDVLGFNYFIANLGEYQTDMTHPTATGALSLAQMWARAIDRNVFGLDKPVPTKTVTVTFESRDGALRANLTGLKWTWADVFGKVIDTGIATTDASGVFSITVRSYLASGGIGYLDVTNSDGTVNENDFAFSGPVEVA